MRTRAHKHTHTHTHTHQIGCILPLWVRISRWPASCISDDQLSHHVRPRCSFLRTKRGIYTVNICKEGYLRTVDWCGGYNFYKDCRRWGTRTEPCGTRVGHFAFYRNTNFLSENQELISFIAQPENFNFDELAKQASVPRSIKGCKEIQVGAQFILSIFINLHVSGDYVPIIRRNSCFYAKFCTRYSVWMTVWYAVWNASFHTAYQTVIHTE